MSLFAKKKCDRCGTKFRSKSEEKAICEACEEELATFATASKENTRECPIDGTPMEKSIAHMIVIDRCPACHGVWLDRGELEKVYSRASKSALVEVTRNLWFPIG
ncbi:MAG TPA: zf-TFIIB domain-containing protein [Gammaproteobacteria bacterium]|nr:zf-TFIIB domain-containing protein [Gammaproteobacteria bacterium]